MFIHEIPDLLDAVDKVRGDFAVGLLGCPGVGKSQSIYDWAKKNGRNVCEIIASQCQPSEISGIVMPESDRKVMSIYNNERMTSLKDGDVLFFDELLTAPVSVLNACLYIIQERKLMSGERLADVIVVAASNPPASPSMVSRAQRQRFQWFDVKFNDLEWKKYINQRYFDFFDIPSDALEVVGVNKFDVWESSVKNLVYYVTRCAEDPASMAMQWNLMTPRSLEKMLKLLIENDFDDNAMHFAKELDNQSAMHLHKIHEMSIAYEMAKMLSNAGVGNDKIYEANASDLSDMLITLIMAGDISEEDVRNINV